MSLKSVSKFCAVAALGVSCAFAVTPPIGIASALGTFTLNDAKVEGNANIFDGALIKTTSASSRVYLQAGSELTLATHSAATFYKDHVVLAEGATRIEGMKTYSIHAAGYRIQSTEPLSEAVVRLTGDNVQIAALMGAVNVYSDRGALLTRIAAGTASSFDTQPSNAGPQNPTPNTGQTGATPNNQTPSGATTGAAPSPNKTKLYITLGTAMAGLGLATDAILQPGTPTPTSP